MRPLDPSVPRAPRLQPPLQAPPPRSQTQLRAAGSGPYVYQRARHVPRRDPAPSRLAFRLQRLWLTPAVRALTRIGVPVFAVALGLGLWLGDQGRRAEIVERYETVKETIQHRPEFMVSLLKIDGASPEVDSAIRAMLPVQLPASSFNIDLDAYRDTIRKLDAVADVALVIRNGGTLEAKVTERVPALLWRTPTGLEMLDAGGHRVATLVAREVRPDLPLIAGAGADRAAPEALRLIAGAGPLMPRLRGLVRMGERRWDVVLDRGQRIALPEKGAVQALDRILALDAAEDLLARDFTMVDLRNGERPTIRLSAHALEAFQEIQQDAVKARVLR